MSVNSRYRNYNKPNLYNIVPIIIMCSFFSILGIYRYYLISNYNFLILILSISFFIFLAYFIREFVLRPKYIEADDRAIILSYRFNKPKNIPWNDVKKIDIFKKTNFPIFGRIGEDGVIYATKFESGVLITCEIAQTLNDLLNKKLE